MQDKVHSAFFRELYKRYSFDDIKTKLKFSDDNKTKSVLKSLKSAGIVKVIDSKKAFELERLQEEEIITDEIATDNSHAFVFNFVGIAYTENSIIKCYPKYVEEDSEYFLPHFKQVLQVLKKYNNTKDYNLKYFDLNDEGKNFNRMEIELFILEDYFENGIYTNQESVIETNGSGEIDWDRTINSTLAIIKNSKPYYFELQTINTQNNDEDFFKLLHECILTECSHHLGKNGADILELFDMEEVELSGLNLSDFGDAEYIKYRIEQELRNQFVTQKQNLLKILLSYVTEKDFRNQKSDFSFFGTNAFNMVWEKSCGQVFQNQLEKFKKIIDQPHWTYDKIDYSKSDTLTPDIISIDEQNKRFCILDAKYYNIDSSKFLNYPGVQDVVKQFAYNKLFSEYMRINAFDYVLNAFLIPKYNNQRFVTANGDVNLTSIQRQMCESLPSIKILEIDPSMLFAKYIQDETYNIISEQDISDQMTKLKHCFAVGFFRTPYYDQIREQKKDFIFYCYFQKGKYFYPVHDDLFYCSYLYGSNSVKNQTEFIRGKITSYLGILDRQTLNKKLKQMNFCHKASGADYYYCFNVTFEQMITDRGSISKLLSKCTDYPYKDILSDYSPKVFDADN